MARRKKKKKMTKKSDIFHAKRELLMQENDFIAVKNIGECLGLKKLKDTKNLHNSFKEHMKGKW